MTSLTSNHLCQVSANLLRSSRKHVFDQIDVSHVPTAKRRCLEMKSGTAQKENNGGNTVHASLCERSDEMTLDTSSNQENIIQSEKNDSINYDVGSENAGFFQRKIKIELLKIVDLIDEIDGIRSITGGEFETRCTLEVYIAEYEHAAGKLKLRCGEDVWRSQQMCLIQTTRDDFGHSTSKLIMPSSFLIRAEDLVVKKESREMSSSRNRTSKLGLSDQYIVKAWLEAPSAQHRWPPLDLESALDPHGRIMTCLQKGIFSSFDMRLTGKGLLFPEEGSLNSLQLFLKLGDFRVQTNYALKLDIKYSIPAEFKMPQKTPQLHIMEPLSETKSTNKGYCSVIACDANFIPDSENVDVSMRENETSRIYRQKRSLYPQLVVPFTKKRLCGDVVKMVLNAGEELDAVDDELETDWQITRHQETINNVPGTNDSTKEYISKWNLHVFHLRLSCNHHLPQVLLEFVKENMTWFAEDSRHVREFSLHASSLRLRGNINMECFTECSGLLRDCMKPGTCLPSLKSTDIQTINHSIDGEYYFKHSTNKTTLGGGALNRQGKLGDLKINHTDGGKRGMEVAESETLAEESLNFQTSTKEVRDQEDETLKDTANTRVERDREIRKAECIEVNDTFEDAGEEYKIPGADDFFDAEDESCVSEQPSYFPPCWKGITERWPRLKLHGTYSFGVACLLVAIAIFQGFPSDNIDRMIALYIHYCPNENIKDIIDMYYHATEVVPEVEGVYMTELKLHKLMWEASRETCEYWLTDVYRLEGGLRKTVQEAIETATNTKAWEEMWECISRRFGS